MYVELEKHEVPAHLAQFFEPVPGLKQKDACGIPWRVALALQADGWYLRSDIIWHKNNPMPESVTDRPTKSHEYLFLLSKQERYYYDADAVREPHKEARSFLGKEAKTVYRGAISGGADNRYAPGPCGYGQPAAGRNLRSVWTIPTESYAGAHFACVDEKTECLTTAGWKLHDELESGMLAAQFDLDSRCLSWAPIEDVARYSVTGEPMVHAKSRDVEMILTPNHRTIISRRHPRTRQWGRYHVIRADELKPSHAVPVSAPWEGIFDSPVSPDWAELIGWYIAEGCQTNYDWTVEIYQSHSANPEKVERIRALLRRVGAEFSEASATRQWRGEDRALVAFQVQGFAAAYLRQWCPNKGFHPSVAMWSDLLLGRLLDGLVDGDGHRRDDGRFSFIQRSKPSSDIAQLIGVRLGYATMLSRRTEETFTVYFTKKRLISFRGTAGEGAEIGMEPYTGIVWCPKLPEGTWVARRNGRAFITGNTFPRKLVEPCIKAGTSERGACPTCGAPWERVTEKGESMWEERKASGAPMRAGDIEGGRSLGSVESKFSGAVLAAWKAEHPDRHLGWRPTCTHDAEPVPCRVFDPFAGSGTTLVVAEALGRVGIGCDLSSDYLAQARRRIERPHQPPPKHREQAHPLFAHMEDV